MTHVRRAIRVAALAVLTASLFGCGSDDSGESTSVSLDVEIQDWTGWQEEQPSPELMSVTIREGSAIDLPAHGGPIRLTVTDVKDDLIELETDDSLVINEDDAGIDFDDATTRFTLDRSEPLKLTTPTMDEGTSFTLSVE